MRGAETHQISTIVQQRYLAVTAGASEAVDVSGFLTLQFLAGVAAPGAITLEVEESADGVAGWTPLIPAYYKAEGMSSSAEGTSVLKVTATTTKANQLVAVSLFHQGRENAIGSGIKKFLRVKVTGTASFILANLGIASWHPVEQPSFAVAETKGTIG
jgi:hypothetical protein